jgi:hypothetical protein
MVTFLYRCPNSGHRIQGYIATEAESGEQDRYESVTCSFCQQVHFVNPATGKVLGQDQE